jgi:hypothetical protein
MAENIMLKKPIQRWLDHSLLAKVDLDHGEARGINKTLVNLIFEAVTQVEGNQEHFRMRPEQMRDIKDSLKEAEGRGEANLLKVVVNTYVARGAIRLIGPLESVGQRHGCVNRVCLNKTFEEQDLEVKSEQEEHKGP